MLRDSQLLHAPPSFRNQEPFFLTLLAPFLEPIEHHCLLKKIGGPERPPLLWVNGEGLKQGLASLLGPVVASALGGRGCGDGARGALPTRRDLFFLLLGRPGAVRSSEERRVGK